LSYAILEGYFGNTEDFDVSKTNEIEIENPGSQALYHQRKFSQQTGEFMKLLRSWIDCAARLGATVLDLFMLLQ
jgi:hypothetical protein